MAIGGAATTLAQSGLANGLDHWQVRAQNGGGTTDADGGTWWTLHAWVRCRPTFTQERAGQRGDGTGQLGDAAVVGAGGRGLLGVLGHDEQQHV